MAAGGELKSQLQKQQPLPGSMEAAGDARRRPPPEAWGPSTSSPASPLMAWKSKKKTKHIRWADDDEEDQSQTRRRSSCRTWGPCKSSLASPPRKSRAAKGHRIHLPRARGPLRPAPAGAGRRPRGGCWA
ncbi:Hypothetical predicted protein [Podarcis lilfordi]|uniref:Uncharacterized protein n=1 Tax=Podarcis lilfordi TaxID=74358 RepID=A0AA35K9A7_9SAUR|nr:Hypothetical predicted protein [Podarcis lilfordi]